MSEKQIDGQWVDRIVKSLQGIEYRSVKIVTHDSQITQIDRLEKHQFLFKKQAFENPKQVKIQLMPIRQTEGRLL